MARYNLVVVEKIHEADDTCSLRFELPAEVADDFAYSPGQFVHVRAVVDGAPVERSYSLSSAPQVDPHFQLTIKRVESGALSPFLVEQVQRGDRLEVSEPQGRFFDENAGPARHYLLFAAGSGISPLYSILKWLLGRERGDRVTLVYASRCESGIIFRAELDALAAAHGERLRLVHVLSRPAPGWTGESGRLVADAIERLLGPRDAGGLPEIAYLCGPEAFMASVAEALEQRGLAPRDIRRESFATAEAVSADALDDETTVRILPEGTAEDTPVAAAPQTELTVAIDGEEHSIVPQPGETILAALQRAEIDAPFSCQEGTCLSCMCRVEQGAVRMRRHELIGLTPEDLGEGIALACLSKAEGTRVRVSFEDV
ncbi:ferredoxin--NADP reductase [Ancylobacter sp. MQZ15Z-1]|uniref:Ferredoxin--NADP reductase n=1 Tax=Ancylobacter mangrovi TaxID=2972472 RepID=A0A9X2PCY6_9HYPH|nr:ferredoxin--NADP reductase [Ancylobacter mangrovi]MCS0495655.1 ferredoxin--NADP reductase [Ancylobacter mangrovi]